MGARPPQTATTPLAARTLDIGRALAISLVIYGHALAPWFLGTEGWFSPAAFYQWKFGAAFIMPFFFVVSGLGWRADKSVKASIRESLVLIATAWAASLVLDAMRIVFTLMDLSAVLQQEPVDLIRFVRHAARMAILGDFYTLSALWFLAALGIVRLFAAAAVRIGAIGSVLMVLGLIAAGLFAQLMEWRNIQQIYLLGMSLGFFLFGHIAKPWFELLLKRLDIAAWVTIVAGVGALATFDLNQGCTFDLFSRCGAGALEGRFGVAMIYGGYGNLLLFVITATLGVSFALAGTALIARRLGRAGDRLAVMGRNTINLLIVNAFVLELANPALYTYVAPHIPANNLLFFIALFVIAFVVTVGGAALLKTPLKMLRSFVRAIARFAVDTVFGPMLPAIWALRRNRVPAVHD